MASRVLCLTALLVLAMPALHADEVQIGANSRLSGTILGMRRDKLRFSTEYLGIAELDWGNVTDIRSDGDLAVYPEGGEVLVGVLAGIEGGTLQVRTADGVRGVDIRQVNLISTELPRGEKPTPVVQWRGGVQFGFGWITGNKERNDWLVAGDLRRKSTLTELLFSAVAERGETKTGTGTEPDLARMRGGVTFNWNQGGRRYLSVNTILQQDDVQKLMLRQNHALSMGYRLVQQPRFTWNVEVGGNYVWEKFSRLNSTDDVTVRLFSATQMRVLNASTLSLSMAVHPSVRSPYPLRAVSDLTLSFPLTRAISLGLSATHDYNNTPRPEGVKASDFRTRTTLGHTF